MDKGIGRFGKWKFRRPGDDEEKRKKLVGKEIGGSRGYEAQAAILWEAIRHYLAHPCYALYRAV
jgi:hypothetical protein